MAEIHQLNAPAKLPGPQLKRDNMAPFRDSMPQPNEWILLCRVGQPPCFARWGADGEGYTAPHVCMGFIDKWSPDDRWIGIGNLIK